MIRANRKCAYCGEEYYCCKSCISNKSWKNICCSVKCFRKLSEKKDFIEPIKKEIVDIDSSCLYGYTKDKKIIDIIGYDLELGKFDCADNITRTFDEFEKFIISKDELKNISIRLNNLIEKDTREMWKYLSIFLGLLCDKILILLYNKNRILSINT